MSFEAVNGPGYFLRHRNGDLWVEKDGGGSFAGDATFLLVAALVRPPKGAARFRLVQQGDSATCWIFSAMQALQYSGVELPERVRTDGKGNYRVRLFNYHNFHWETHIAGGCSAWLSGSR